MICVFFSGWTGHFACNCLDAQCYGCDEFGHLAQDCPHKFLNQEHHAAMADLFQGITKTTTRGTDHTPIMVPDIGNDTADCSHAPIHAMTEVAVLEDTPHTLLLATTAACITLQPMDAPMTPHAIVTPHLTTFPTGTTNATPQTGANPTPSISCHTTQGYQPRKVNAQDPQHPINPTTPKLSPSRILI